MYAWKLKTSSGTRQWSALLRLCAADEHRNLTQVV